MTDDEWVWAKVSEISQAFASGQVEEAHELIEEVLAEINRDEAPAFYEAFAMIAEYTHSIRAFEDYMDLNDNEYRPETREDPVNDALEGPVSDAPEDPESDDGGETFSNVGEDLTGDDSGVEFL